MFKGIYYVGLGVIGTLTFNNLVQSNQAVSLFKTFTEQSISSAIAANSRSPSPTVEMIQGTIVAVSDGDTATVRSKYGDHVIRMFAIDAPEVKCHGFSDNVCVEDGQANGGEAKRHLRNLILKKEVTVKLGQGMSGKRLVGTILADGKDVNLEMVKSGYAWHYKYYAKNQTVDDRKAYADAHNNAKWLRIGLWDDNNPVAPWDWRHKNKN